MIIQKFGKPFLLRRFTNLQIFNFVPYVLKLSLCQQQIRNALYIRREIHFPSCTLLSLNGAIDRPRHDCTCDITVRWKKSWHTFERCERNEKWKHGTL